MERQRLDVYLAKADMARSRSDAQNLIKSGAVYINGSVALKTGEKVDGTEKIEIKDSEVRYVSRGGKKIEKAINVFEIELKDKVCMDIGASTGGFTDCMLKNGAKRVFAVDVGSGQLADELKNDPRVVNMEKTNIRYLSKEDINQENPNDEVEFFSVDVSFISLCQVLPPVYNLISDNAHGVCLIKPQFEAGKGNVGKSGVVKGVGVHCDVIQKVLKYIKDSGFTPIGLDFSPIKGPEGNIEYLVYIKKGAAKQELLADDAYIYEVVRQSHETAK